jgi:hypothetical protein
MTDINPLGNWPEDVLTCHRLLNVKEKQLAKAGMQITSMEAAMIMLNEDNEGLRKQLDTQRELPLEDE